MYEYSQAGNLELTWAGPGPRAPGLGHAIARSGFPACKYVHVYIERDNPI